MVESSAGSRKPPNSAQPAPDRTRGRGEIWNKSSIARPLVRHPFWFREEMNATIVRGAMQGSWAPGYYYVLFEDPDGIRLEVNFVPGAGLLADGAQFNPATGYV